MNCLFCKIINGEIPSKKAFENENIYAFYDIAPQAPVHILVIPKAHIESVDGINAENSAVVAEIFENIPRIAKEAGIENGYRVICTIHDLDFDLMQISLYAPDLMQAEILKKRFMNDPSGFYQNVINYLTNE